VPIYPICYKEDSWNALPATCSYAKKQIYAQYGFREPKELITSWIGDVPFSNEELERSGYYGPHQSTEIVLGNVEKEPGLIEKIGGFLQNLLDVADRSQQNAVKLGYVAAFAVGAGLLFWYVPRKKR